MGGWREEEGGGGDGRRGDEMGRREGRVVRERGGSVGRDTDESLRVCKVNLATLKVAIIAKHRVELAYTAAAGDRQVGTFRATSELARSTTWKSAHWDSLPTYLTARQGKDNGEAPRAMGASSQELRRALPPRCHLPRVRHLQSASFSVSQVWAVSRMSRSVRQRVGMNARLGLSNMSCRRPPVAALLIT